MTTGWELFWTALIGGFAGALAAGLLGFAVAREAQRREARARILRETLPELHNSLNGHVSAIGASTEPSGQPDQLGKAYSVLMRDAAAASAADYRWLLPFQELWDEVGVVFGEYFEARRALKDPDELAEATVCLRRRQMPIWRDLNTLLRSYNEWLIWQLTRPWWWPITPRRCQRGRLKLESR